jgi:hypothetical protein
MAIEILAAIISAIACAGVAMLIRKLSGARLPKWFVPAAAGAGMIGFTIWSEYDWFDRMAANLPEGVTVVWQEDSAQPLRPWTMLAPLSTRFLALDTRTLARHPANDDLVMAEMYAFARWQAIEPGLVVVDCAADRMVRLTTETRIDDAGLLTGGEWQPIPENDQTGDMACRRTSDG